MPEIDLSKLNILPKKHYLALIGEILSTRTVKLSKSLGNVNFQDFTQNDIETLEELILTQILFLNTLVYYEELRETEIKENNKEKEEF